MSDTILYERPKFEQGQVLTHADLNQLVDALEAQDQATRRHTIGVGIIAGLEARFTDDEVTISLGAGITTDGWLIVLSHAKRQCTDYRYPFFARSAGTKRPPMVDPGAEWFELLLDDDVDLADRSGLDATRPPESVTALAPYFEEQFVVSLWLEALEIDLLACGLNDCGDKGKRVRHRLRVIVHPGVRART